MVNRPNATKKKKAEGRAIHQLQMKLHRMKVSQRPAPAPKRKAQNRPRQVQVQTLATSRNQMRPSVPRPSAGLKIHPFFSWDPLSQNGVVPEIFNTGPSTYVPVVARKQLKTGVYTTGSVGIPMYGGGLGTAADPTPPPCAGYSLLVTTSSHTGIAGLWGTCQLIPSAGSDPSYWSFMGEPILFSKLTTGPGGNDPGIPDSARSGRHGLYLRNTTDQLALGGTVRVLRLSTGITLPETKSIGTPHQFTQLIDYITDHHDTATYSGNQLTTGKGLACIPCNQTDYMDYQKFNPASSDMGIEDYVGGDNYTRGKSLMVATGYDGTRSGRFGSKYAHLEGVAAAGGGVDAVRKAAANATKHVDADNTGINALSAADHRFMQNAVAADTFDAALANPEMSVCLILFEPRNAIDKVNTYELSIGHNTLTRFPPDSLLNALARPAPTAPLAFHNQMRTAGASTRSFLSEVGDVASKVGKWASRELPGVISAGTAMWNAAKTVGGIVAPLLI